MIKQKNQLGNKINNIFTNKKTLRFILVGISNTFIDFFIMNILRLLTNNLLFSNTISTGVAMLYSFFMNKKWTFKNKGNDYISQIIMFFIFTIIGIWVIQNFVLYIIINFIPSFGLPVIIFDNVAKLLASIPSLIWNYYTYDKFVFKKSTEVN